ncbi:MAG: hypothetical protein HN764_10685 [Gammaproteobacteria bacterium]|nr:hypothetical protein [Gammaproteobacteria bacterium]
MTEFLRWIIAIPLLAVSLYFILTNIRFLLENFRLGLNAGPAPMTIMGGLSGCLGLLILPYMEFTDRLALLWLPLILDLGSLPFYVSLLVLTICQGMGVRLWKNHPDYQTRGNT